MPPEQLVLARDTDGRSDLYSLGCSLYFLLTGRNAFFGTTPQEIFQAVMERKFLTPREIRPAIPQTLEDIVLKLMSPEPQLRFDTAKDLAHTLRAWRLQEQLESGRLTSDAMAFESVDELGQILLKLQIVREADWEMAHEMAYRGERGSRATGGIYEVESFTVTTSHYRSFDDSPRFRVERVLDALGLVCRDAGRGRGLTLWQRNAVTQDNADLLRLPHHVLCEKIGFGWKGEVFVARNLESDRLESVRTFAASALSGLCRDEPHRLTRFIEHATRVAAVKHSALAKVESFDRCQNRASHDLHISPQN